MCPALLERFRSTRIAVTGVLTALAGPVVSALPAGASLAAAVEPPVLIAKSPYSVDQTLQRLRAAAEGNNFRIIREQTVDYGLVDEQSEDRQRRILYFCNFETMHSALQVDRRIGVFLPCQVTVVHNSDGVLVIAPNPKAINATFLANPDLAAACDRLRQAYVDILEEATL